jgi:hypothetical protein
MEAALCSGVFFVGISGMKFSEEDRSEDRRLCGELSLEAFGVAGPPLRLAFDGGDRQRARIGRFFPDFLAAKAT